MPRRAVRLDRDQRVVGIERRVRAVARVSRGIGSFFGSRVRKRPRGDGGRGEVGVGEGGAREERRLRALERPQLGNGAARRAAKEGAGRARISSHRLGHERDGAARRPRRRERVVISTVASGVERLARSLGNQSAFPRRLGRVGGGPRSVLRGKTGFVFRPAAALFSRGAFARGRALASRKPRPAEHERPENARGARARLERLERLDRLDRLERRVSRAGEKYVAARGRSRRRRRGLLEEPLPAFEIGDPIRPQRARAPQLVHERERGGGGGGGRGGTRRRAAPRVGDARVQRYRLDISLEPETVARKGAVAVRLKRAHHRVPPVGGGVVGARRSPARR